MIVTFTYAGERTLKFYKTCRRVTIALLVFLGIVLYGYFKTGSVHPLGFFVGVMAILSLITMGVATIFVYYRMDTREIAVLQRKYVKKFNQRASTSGLTPYAASEYVRYRYDKQLFAYVVYVLGHPDDPHASDKWLEAFDPCF